MQSSNIISSQEPISLYNLLGLFFPLQETYAKNIWTELY